MKTAKIFVLLSLATLLCPAMQSFCLGNIKITPPAGLHTWNYEVSCHCPAPPGGCSDICITTAYPYSYLAPPTANSDVNKVFVRDYGGTEQGGWKLLMSTPWNGDLTVTQYQPLVCRGPKNKDNYDKVNHTWPDGWVASHCHHGTILEMSYEPDFEEPTATSVNVLQYIQITGWGCGRDVLMELLNNPAGGKSIDPAPHQQDPPNPLYPFVWADSGKAWYLDVPGSGCNNLAHCDRRVCPQRGLCKWEVFFETYLVSVDFENNISVHDGIRWGYESVCMGGPNPKNGAPVVRANPGASINYDPLTEMLSIGNSVIDILNLDGSDVMDANFADDPIYGATISMSDFSFKMDADGAYIFEGGKYTISKDDVVFFEADVPYLLIEEDSNYTDNLYAPFVDPVFNLDAGSAWLAAYEQYYWGSDFYPEFRGETCSSIEPSLAGGLSYSDTAYISAAYCTEVIPEPATVFLLCMGMAGLARRRRKKTF